MYWPPQPQPCPHPHALHHLFDGPDNLKLSRGVKVSSFLAQQQPQISRDVTARDVYPHDGVWHGKALIDGDSVSDPVPRV